MPSPYDVLVVGSGPAGGTAARYAARRGLKVVLVDRGKEIGVPVQCGEYVAHNDEVRAIFPTVDGLDDLMEIPYRVREVDTPVIRVWSPRGRRYDVPFRGFTVRRDRMDQGIAAQAADEGAEILTETTVTRLHGDEVEANRGFVPVLGPPPRTVKDNAMLVGDAAGMVMATNGGGNNVAMIAGRIAGLTAADHLLDGTPLDAYETRWRSAVGGPLDRGVRIKRLADRFFGSDRLLEAAMVLIGRGRMARAIRCQRLILPSGAKAL